MSSAAVASSTSVPVEVKGKTKIEPRSTKEAKKALKENLELYRRIAAGLPILPHDETYLTNTKTIAQELLTRTEAFLEKYDQLSESTETKRSAVIKPRLCDRGLTELFFRAFRRGLPVVGAYGVCDLNRIATRAFSVYVKANSLGEGQFFTCDDELERLFNSKTVSDPTKTYLQVALERIAELRNKDGYKPTTSSADIVTNNGRISMNYAALKIIVPHFGVDYDLSDAARFIPQLEEFGNYLNEEHTQYEERKKAAKKASNKK